MKTKRNRALKPKDVERLEVLQRKHPGDRSEAETAEMEKLQTIRAKHGELK